MLVPCKQALLNPEVLNTHLCLCTVASQPLSAGSDGQLYGILHLHARLWNSPAFVDALQSPDPSRLLQEATSNRPGRHSTPVGPVSPVAPVGPVIPVFPVRPVAPVGPVTPSRPVAPVGPAQWNSISCYSLSQASCQTMLAGGRQAVSAHSLQGTNISFVALTTPRK